MMIFPVDMVLRGAAREWRVREEDMASDDAKKNRSCWTRPKGNKFIKRSARGVV